MQLLGMIVFLVMVLLDALILQPFKVVFLALIKLCWKPAVKYSKVVNVTNLAAPAKDYEQYYESSVNSALEDADGFKFLAILAGTCDDYDTPDGRGPQLTKKLLDYISSNGIIGRYIVGHYDRYTAPTFSGDMLSGLLYWLSELVYRPECPFNYTQLRKLQKLFEHNTFLMHDGGTSWKLPLVFWKAKVETERTPFFDDRGKIYSLLGLGSQMFRTILWLELAYSITDKFRYKFFAILLKILFFPMLILDNGDPSFFIRTNYYISWYTTHSSAYVQTAYLVWLKNNPGISFYRWRLRSNLDLLQRRYPNNVNYKLLHEMYGRGKTGYTPIYLPPKGTHSNVYTEPYRNVLTGKRKWLTTTWLGLEFFGHPFVWENNLLSPLQCDTRRRTTQCLDYILISFLSSRLASKK